MYLNFLFFVDIGMNTEEPMRQSTLGEESKYPGVGITDRDNHENELDDISKLMDDSIFNQELHE